MGGSSTPGLVAFETVTINADGKFCTLAYPIPANHNGEFKAEIGDKSDNYRVSCERGCPDADSDGTPDCSDEHPNDPNKIEQGTCDCGCSVVDTPDCGGSKEAPTTILYHPTGGETLKRTVAVTWFVHDSQDEHWNELPIYLYYFDDSDNWYLLTIGY